MVISSGIMIAVPLACTTRPTTSAGNPGASAHRSVPRENSVIAAAKTGRVASRWSRYPVIGMTTAMVSMNAVVSHCPALRLDAQVRHDPRQRDAHDRLVEDDDEGRDEQQGDDEAALGGEPLGRGEDRGGRGGLGGLGHAGLRRREWVRPCVERRGPISTRHADRSRWDPWRPGARAGLGGTDGGPAGGPDPIVGPADARGEAIFRASAKGIGRLRQWRQCSSPPATPPRRRTT